MSDKEPKNKKIIFYLKRIIINLLNFKNKRE